MIDLDDIPCHKHRPIRYSLTLIGLCFGASFVVHAAVVLGLVLTPVPNASKWSSAGNNAQQAGDRHVVRVTMKLSATDFAPPPSLAEGQAREAQRVEPVPPVPVAVPELPKTSDDLPASTQPTTAKPPRPEQPIDQPPQTQPALQPIALDLPRTPRHDAPLPPIAELSKVEPNDLPESREPVQVPDAQPQAALPEVPLAETPTQLPGEPAQSPKAPQSKQAQTATDANTEPSTAEPAAQTAEASEDGKAETQPPEESQADDPPAAVYDQDSVDRLIAFDKKVRPRPSMLSKRRGESGNVRIKIEVDASGNLLGHEVLDDAGYPRLLAAALEALKASSFEPAVRGDRPVRSTRVVEYRF